MQLIRRKSLTFRLTLLFASISTTVLLVLGLLVGAMAERHFEELDMELLTGNLELFQRVLEKVKSEQQLEALPHKLDDLLVGHHGLVVTITEPNGRLLFSSGKAEFPNALLSIGTQAPTTPIVWLNSENHRYRGISAEFRTGLKSTPLAIVAVATDIAHHEHFMMSFKLAMWAVIGVAALLTGFLGWFAARRGLAPLIEIRKTAADITVGHLDYRLSVTSIPIEVSEVVETLNEMLARLQKSFQRLSDFSSDLAHELRTPVSNLLTQTQVTLTKNRTPDQYRNVLVANMEELERLSRMVSDMLFLAKSDNTLIVPNQESVDLNKEVSALFEFYDALAAEKNIQLTLSGQGLASGDKLMLRRAINNLLSNAIRCTPKGGHVTVRLEETADCIVDLSVENTGDTIHAEHLPRLFDRFYRVDSSRARFSEGSGLGLAITRSIMRAHGGEVFVHSVDGVTVFKLRLPQQSLQISDS